MHWPHTFAVYLIYSYLRGSIRTTDCVLFQNDFKLHLLSKQPILEANEKTWKDQGKTCSAGRSCGKKSRGECFDQRPGGRYHDFGGVSQWIIPENSRRLAPVSERHSALTFYGMRVYIYIISGWWFQTWNVFSISYMGCHPSHWLSYFSRWLKPPTRYYFIHLRPFIRSLSQLYLDLCNDKPVYNNLCVVEGFSCTMLYKWITYRLASEELRSYGSYVIIRIAFKTGSQELLRVTQQQVVGSHAIYWRLTWWHNLDTL